MLLPQVSVCGYVVLLVSGAYGGIHREPVFEDDLSTSQDFDEDAFYNNHPDHDSPVSRSILSAEPYDGFIRSDDGLERRQSSTANPNTNPVLAGGLPVSPTQNQNVTSIPNVSSTDGTINGLTPGLIGNLNNPNEDKVNCSDPVTGRSNDCWHQLKLSQYVNDWVDTHECYKGEGFATCYLRQNGFTTLDCSGIALDACPPPQDPQLVLDPQKFYVAYNIYCEYNLRGSSKRILIFSLQL